MTIGLPGSNGLNYATVLFDAIGQGYQNATAWYGHFPSPNTGDIMLQSSNGFVSGYMQFNDNYYLITPIGEGPGVILRLDTNAESFGNISCGNIPNSENGSNPFGPFDEPTESCFNEGECHPDLKILVVMNQSAQTWCESFGTTNWFGETYIGYLFLYNQFFIMAKGFINSKINANLHFEFYYYNNVPFTNNYLNDINNIKDNQFIWELQKTQQADIILFCSNVEYTVPSGAAGVASTQSGPQIDKLFAVVDIDQIIPIPQLVAHELGHLLGGMHERPSAAGDGYCNHARVFNWPHPDVEGQFIGYKTIIGSGLALARPTIHYSNPEVLFGYYLDSNLGIVVYVNTGTRADDNAGIINENICNKAKANIYADMAPVFTPKYKKVCVEQGTFEQCVAINIPPNNRALQPSYSVYWYWNNVKESPHFYPNSLEYFIDITSESDDLLCLEIPISSVPSTQNEFFLITVIEEDLTGENISIVSDKIIKDHSTGCMHTLGIVKKTDQPNKQVLGHIGHNIPNEGIKPIVKVYRLDGRLVSTHSNISHINDLRKFLPNGIYIVKTGNHDCIKLVVNDK